MGLRLFDNRRIWKFAVPAFILIASFAWPIVHEDSFLLNVAINLFFYIFLGFGMHLIFGTIGLPFLGYAGFFAIGAYVTAILTTRGVSFWISLILAVCATCLLALFFGSALLKLRGDYFMLGSLSLGEIIHLTVNNLDITGGPNGIVGIPRPQLFNMSLNQPIHFYYLLLLLIVVSFVFLTYLMRSSIGRSWLAVKEDELASEAIGISTYRVKLQVFVLGSIWAGVAGAIFAARLGVVSPGSFTLMNSIQMLGIVIVGGMGSITGVILGAFLMIGLPEIIRFLADWRLVSFGIAIMLVLRFRPQGIWPSSPWIIPLPAIERIKPLTSFMKSKGPTD